MRKLTFANLVAQSRVLVGDAAEVREKVAHVRGRLHLTDLPETSLWAACPTPSRAPRCGGLWGKSQR